MRKKAFLFVLMISGCWQALAGELPKRAQEHPLDFAFYLITKGNDDRHAEAMANAFFEVGRFDDAARGIEIENNEHTKINWFAFRARLLDERQNAEKTRLYVDQALKLIKLENVDADKEAALALAELLIKFNRTHEAVQLLENADRREAVLIGIVREFIKAHKTAAALKLLPPLADIEADDDKAEIIELYARLKQTEKTDKMLAEFEPAAFVNTPVYHNQRFILFPLINANLALGRRDHAVELWEQYGEKDDGYGWIKFIGALIEFGHREKANVYLAQVAADSEILKSEGSDVVAAYLKLGDIEKAAALAKTMTVEFDSHEQQAGLMHVADHFIADSKTDAAANVLDFALRRASKVVFQHEDLQSTSAGTHKRMYLHNIYRRYMKIGQYSKARAAIDAIGSEHWIAQEFVMQSLFDFLKQRAKKLPRRETEIMLKRMQNSFTERDDDYQRSQAKLFAAEIYARLGEKQKAAALLARVIREGKESCCHEFEFLLGAGKVFELYKLEPDANIKKALGEF